jgi:UDP-glucose-4-epimerase GalE
VKLLVTGGAGYVGSHTVKELTRRGHEVIVYDSLERGYRWAVRDVPLVQADLTDAAALAGALAGRDVAGVLHFAGYTYVGESVGDPRRYFENNVGAALTLLRVMLEHDVRLIVFSSTAAVYGNPREVPIPEDHPLEPVNPYGASKLMVERVLADYGRAYGLRHVSLRYFNAAGADPEGELGEAHDPETHLIPRVLAVALGAADHIDVYGADYPTPDGTCIRDYVHVTDLADAHVRAIELVARTDRSGTFNLGTGRGYSVAELITRAEAIAGVKIPTRVAARRPGDPAALVSRPDRAQQELGWRPRLSTLDRILETAWAWHRRHRPGDSRGAIR